MKASDFVPPIINKLFSSKVEVKSSSLQFWPDSSFPEFLLDGGNGDLSAFAAIKLYEQVMPFFNAVDMRSQGVSGIQPRIFDRVTSQFLPNNELIELLRKPNADVSQVEFLEQISSFYDITGDAFILATGRIENPPIELATIPPQSITFASTSNKFGMLHVPDSITVNNTGGEVTKFKAQEDPRLGLRYINQFGDKELWHIRSFNPVRNSSRFRGMSRARSVWIELQQFQEGNINNLSLLKRGTRISMAWVNNRGEELTETQWSRMQEEAQKYAGSKNTGGTPVLDGMDIKSIQSSNKDMQFKDLQESMLARISTIYGIPLALLLPQTMTFNNLQTAMLQLADRAILPLTNRIYTELTRFLMPRYKNMGNIDLRYNQNDIEALKLRMIETAKAQSEIQVNTTDELRAVIGYEELAENGDQVMVDSSKIPLGEDAFTADNLKVPGVASKFVELMRQVKNKDGCQKYKDEEIKLMVEENELQ